MITKSETGDRIKLKLRPDGITTDEIVLPPCDVKDNGGWYCVTHQKGWNNPSEKDAHIERGTHRLVWLCFAHGPEQP